ncbi:hypothetical protein BGX31_004351, partial [Mortierella sp. GBA43]
LYIGGGTDKRDTYPITETFKIDLSVNWTSANPKFEELSNSWASQLEPSTISPDGKEWIMFIGGHIYAMNLATTMSRHVMDLPDIPRAGMAVVEPETGLIYVPHGINGLMLVVNLSGNNYTTYPMPTPLDNSIFYSVAWSVSSRKLFFMGGDNQDAKRSFNLFSYTKSRPWLDLSQSTKGPTPSARSYACLVPAYGGSRLVLFGGFDLSKNDQLGDIYVFDVDTLTWTKGPDTATKDRRHASACAVSGDHFISWGGIGSSNYALMTTTLIYNLKTNQWTTSYIAPPPTAKFAKDPVSPPSSQVPEGLSDSSTSRGVIIGVSIFGAVAAALLATFGYRCGSYRRRVLESANSSTLEFCDPSTLRSPNTDPPSPHLLTAVPPSFTKKSPRNPHFTPVVSKSTSDGEEFDGQSWREAQDNVQEGICLSPHTLVSEDGKYQYPAGRLLSPEISMQSPQQGEFGTSLMVSNPHTIVDDKSTGYQCGLDAYMDSSPNTISYDGGWKNYKKQQLTSGVSHDRSARRKLDKLPPYEQHGWSPALMPSAAAGYSNNGVSGLLPDDQCVRDRNPVEITTTHYNDSNFSDFFPLESRNPQSCP